LVEKETEEKVKENEESLPNITTTTEIIDEDPAHHHEPAISKISESSLSKAMEVASTTKNRRTVLKKDGIKTAQGPRSPVKASLPAQNKMSSVARQQSKSVSISLPKEVSKSNALLDEEKSEVIINENASITALSDLESDRVF